MINAVYVFCDAWCQMRRAFNEAISYTLLAQIIREQYPEAGQLADCIEFARRFTEHWLQLEQYMIG